MRDGIKVLLLAADPHPGSSGLRLDHELRTCVEAVRMGRGQHVEIVSEVALRKGGVIPALERHKPHIVHFAGHGSEANGIPGLALERGNLLDGEQLAVLLAPFPNVRAVLLNACNSLPVAEALHRAVDYVIGMEIEIGDRAAVEFAGLFYAALAFGETVARAFEVANAAMRAEHGDHRACPRLLVREGAPEWPAAAGAEPEQREGNTRQVNMGAGVKVKGDLRSENEAGGARRGDLQQVNDVSGAEIGGSATLSNRSS